MKTFVMLAVGLAALRLMRRRCRFGSALGAGRRDCLRCVCPPAAAARDVVALAAARRATDRGPRHRLDPAEHTNTGL